MDGAGPKNDSVNIFWKCMFSKGYIDDETLGRGRTGIVVKAWSTKLNRHVAVKVIDRTDVREDYYEERLPKELAVWAQMKHPNIVRLFDHAKDCRWTYACMEYTPDKDLQYVLTTVSSSESEYTLEIETAKEWIYQIASALHYLNINGLSHNDVKPKNILLFRNNLKLCDFGSMRFLKDGLVTKVSGTPGYMAPELTKGRPYDAEKADVYSFGVTAYQILTAGTQYFTHLRSFGFKLRNNWASCIPKKSRSLIRETLRKVPSRRLTFDEIMDDDWLNEREKDEDEDDDKDGIDYVDDRFFDFGKHDEFSRKKSLKKIKSEKSLKKSGKYKK